MMTHEERAALRSVACAVRLRDAGTLGDQWELQTSNSFRRIGTRGYGDGDVLCGTKHPRDGHPDLLAAPGVLDYIVAAQPSVVLALLNALEQLEQDVARMRGVCDAAVKFRQWPGRKHPHGNGRPCDACDFETAVDALIGVAQQ